MDQRVALIDCGSYEQGTVDRALDALEECLGLGDGLVPDTGRVLIKPNLLSAKNPDRAITTHPVLVESVARRLRAKGYEVFIGDSPGGAIKGVERYWLKTGLKEAASRAGATLLNFESSGWETIARNNRRYNIARPILEFDFILNMPKLKTHVYAGLTGAVKNLFGSVPGLAKASMHQEAPKHEDFAARILDIFEIAGPTFHIADGVMVIDTKGPSSGRVRPMGCIMASRDGIALDALFAHLADCRIDRYITGWEAAKRGSPGADMKNIEVLGAEPAALKPSDFRVPNIAPLRFLIRYMPHFLEEALEKWIQAWPVSTDACTGCAFCAESCPVGAIDVVSKRAVMDTKKCILCLCCHELCPEGAVDLKRSFLARRIFR